MKDAFTHEGCMVGADARTPRGYRRKVKLRRTKTMWISDSGHRFRNRFDDATEARGFGDWPLWQLVEIREITKEQCNDSDTVAT